MTRSSLLAFTLTLVACRSSSPAAPRADGSDPGAPTAALAPPPASTPAPQTTPPATSPITITNLLPGRFEIEASAPARLRTGAAIEQRQPDGSFRAVADLDAGNGYRLVTKCEAPAETCVDVAPGKALHPVPMRGFSCSAQCNDSCRANVWLGPGLFRLAVRDCDGGAAHQGPAFELPSQRSEAAFVRWGLATNIARATIQRTDLPPRFGPTPETRDPSRIAGFVSRGAPRDLDAAALDALRALLRDEKGYDDLIAKRCKTEKHVGLRVYRVPDTTAAREETVLDEVEIAIDFNCHKLFAAFGGERGGARVVHATHFDPSRAGWLALARAGLPEDKELARPR